MKTNKAHNKLYCDHCEKELLKIDTSINPCMLAAKVKVAGFFVKNLILYVNKDRWVHFCNPRCWKQYFHEKLDVSRDKMDEVYTMTVEARHTIPNAAASVLLNFEKFVKIFSKVKPKNKHVDTKATR